MLAAIALMTVSAQALSCSWGTYVDVTGPSGTFTTGTAYLFLLTGSSAAPTFSGGTWNLNGATQLSSDGSYAGTLDPAWGSANYESMGANNAAVVAGAWYTIVFTTQTGIANLVDVNSGYFYAATAMQGSDDLIDATPTYGVGVYYWDADSLGNPNAGSWTAVPEPTSMALLAFGAAALGLRRKFRK